MAKPPTKMKLKAAAIASCKDRSGRIRPEAVVEAAKDPDSILHGEFEWDVQKAAEKHWINRARELIREVKLIVVHEDIRIVAPYYVTDVTDDSSSYVETTKVARKAAVARETLNDELTRIKAAINRATALAALFGLTATFERMLDLAIEVGKRIEEDGEVISQTATAGE